MLGLACAVANAALGPSAAAEADDGGAADADAADICDVPCTSCVGRVSADAGVAGGPLDSGPFPAIREERFIACGNTKFMSCRPNRRSTDNIEAHHQYLFIQ